MPSGLEFQMLAAIYKTMRGGRVKTVKLEGYQVLPQCFLAGLPSSSLYYKMERAGVSRFKFIPLLELFETVMSSGPNTPDVSMAIGMLL